jgi:hypothetical protein
METKEIHPDVMFALEEARKKLIENKPNERGELARRYAVAITEIDKLLGYVDVFIRQRNYWPLE